MTEINQSFPVLRAGLTGKCPRCIQGGLFQKFLTLKPACSVCHLEYKFADSGDGPAVFVIFIVGFLTVGLLLWADIVFEPPIWIHLMIFFPLAGALSLALLQPIKGVLIALQYKTRGEKIE